MANSGKFWIILNPAAGKGNAAKKLPKIERFFNESGLNHEVHLTKKPGCALETVRNLPLKDNDIVVAAGGDGTCNEVVNGLLTRAPAKDPPVMGVLPIGRGNDFSSTPNIPQDIDKALKLLATGAPRPLDAGIVKGGFFPDGRYFVNGIGIGFDTKVGFEAAKLKIKSGIAYAIGAIIMLIRYEPSPVIQIQYDDQEITLPATLISIVNGRRMGGSFYMGPNALLDDGMLDICIVRHQASRRKLLKILNHYTKGTQAQCDGVFMSKALNFKLKALSGSMACHCDGETVCYEGIELEVKTIPGALRLIGA
jgi:YegS/Rv2252/BmrU family lipid kinase